MAEDDEQDFASVSDLETVWRALDEPEKAKAGKLITQASDLIRTYRGWRYATATTLERICLSVVRRAMESDANGAPSGASQWTQTAGSFTESFSFSNTSGDLRLWPSEEAQLRRRAPLIGSIDMTPRRKPVAHDQG